MRDAPWAGRWLNTCEECGKRAYMSRGKARKAARGVEHSGHVSVYQCGTYWHWGHLPSAVIRGKLDRSSL